MSSSHPSSYTRPSHSPTEYPNHQHVPMDPHSSSSHISSSSSLPHLQPSNNSQSSVSQQHLQPSQSSSGSMSMISAIMNKVTTTAVNVAVGGAAYISPFSPSTSSQPPQQQQPYQTIPTSTSLPHTDHVPSQSSPPDIASSSSSQSGIPLTAASIPQLIANRKYRQTTIIKEGILDKWTNYVGAWRARYFIIEPGILKYANAPGQPIKETFPLVLCSTRFCPGDPLRLEVEHPHGVLYLRMPNGNEKRSWIEALLKAKNIFHQSTNGAAITRTGVRNIGRDIGSSPSMVSTPSNGPPLPPSEVSVYDTAEALIDKYITRGGAGEMASLSDSGDEKSPMMCLIENCVNCRQSLQSSRADIRRLQAEMLRLAGRVRDQQYREDAKNLSVRLVERLDLLQMIMSRHLIGSETLATEERAQRKALEKSLRTIAKRNYRMRLRLQKLQRLLAEEEAQTEQPETLTSAEEGQPISKCASTDRLLKKTESHESLLVEQDEGSGDQSPRVSVGPPESVSTATIGVPTVASDVVPRHVERKRQMASILAGGFTSDENEEEESSSESEDELSSSAGRAPEDEEDFDEFFDAEEMTVASGCNEVGASVPSFASATEGNSNLTSSEQIVRRTELPKPRTDFKVSLWSILKDCIGRDLSTISMPVYFNEPTSFLQRLAEDFQYASLLKEASHYSSAIDRMLWVVLFTISPYSSTIGRTYKPFNPLLGETFEFSHRGFKFLAEQVGHHPPVTAYHSSAQEFEAYGHMTVKNRFTGKSLEVTLPGISNIFLNVDPTEKMTFVNDNSTNEPVKKEHFTFQRARAIVNNVIFGKLSLEMFGHVLVTSHTCGTCAYIEYLRQGWWSREMHVVRGIIFDKDGNPRLRLGGWWSREIWVETLEPYNNPGVSPIIPAGQVLPPEENGSEARNNNHSNGTSNDPPRSTVGGPSGASSSPWENREGRNEFSKQMEGRSTKSVDDMEILDSHHVETPYYHTRDATSFRIQWDALLSVPGTRRVLWRPEARPPHSSRYYEFGQLTMELNELSADYDVNCGAAMPPTDSRYRPDQRWLELGETEKANEEKTRMEEKQRAAARLRVRGEADYNPRWFVRNSDKGVPSWAFTWEYWLAKQGHQFVNCMDIF